MLKLQSNRTPLPLPKPAAPALVAVLQQQVPLGQLVAALPSADKLAPLVRKLAHSGAILLGFPIPSSTGPCPPAV